MHAASRASEWTTAHDREGLVEAFDKALGESVPGAGFAFSQPIEMNTNDLLAGISSDVALHLYGDDLAELRQLGDRIVRVAARRSRARRTSAPSRSPA